ncbi:MAG: universal stress protein [Thermomicrobiales bacterium]
MMHGSGATASGQDLPGRLKVYLGAAPGVGKTYAMLADAHRLRAEGHDVVVGFVEDHGRPETAAQLAGLETLPRAHISYRGVVMEEPDIPALLARRPEIVLLDELAHTNAPGSAREKRYEDIAVLREAGIHVVTTLNVQHLASLHDVVAGITGVAVRELVPDRVLDGAELHLIDLPPAMLIERLEQGKIYPPEQAQRALARFFRAGNLTALRELALRRVAADVDDDLAGYMHEHHIEAIWPATERVLVLLDGHDPEGVVLRNAWRLASALRGELVAVPICSPSDGQRAAGEPGALCRELDVAEDLGARVRPVAAGDVADAIAQAAREERATLIVMRHERRAGWRRRLERSLADLLFEQLDNVAIHLVEAPAPRS